MLKQVLEKKESINKIIYENCGKDWKIFGKVIGQNDFPLRSDISFLITPGKYLTYEKWDIITSELILLFPSYLIRCYTPNYLDHLTETEGLPLKHSDNAKSLAKCLKDLEKLELN